MPVSAITWYERRQLADLTAAVEKVEYQALCGLSLGEAHLLTGPLEDVHTVAEDALVRL